MPTQNVGVSWSTKPQFRRALHCGRQRVFKGTLTKQKYPTEPLRKISALQAILELAGKFLTDIANLVGNLVLAKACWDL